jgi:chromosome segregation ATPase
MKTQLQVACATALQLAAAACLFAETAATPPAVEEQPDPKAAFAAKWEKATVDELLDAVNRLAGESVEQAQAVEEKTVRLDAAWLDPATTSPEIEQLRRTLQDLEVQVLTTRQALRKAAEALPAIQAQREAVRDAAAALDNVKAERAFVQDLLRARLKANREGTP